MSLCSWIVCQTQQKRSVAGWDWFQNHNLFSLIWGGGAKTHSGQQNICVAFPSILCEILTSRKRHREVYLINPNSCLIAAALCTIRPWWAAQSRALEECKIKHTSWSKIPFIVLMISQAKGNRLVEKKDTVRRLVEEADKQQGVTVSVQKSVRCDLTLVEPLHLKYSSLVFKQLEV